MNKKPQLFSQDNSEEQSSIEYTNAENIFPTVHAKIQKTENIIDIGPGLRPVNFFAPKTHILIEGFKDYIPLLQKRFFKQPGVIFINALAQKALPLFADRSVDSIFMLDVLEHMNRRTALKVIKHCIRIARKQVVINTPYGYVEQKYYPGQTDGWNFAYNKLQNHKSGWGEQDFKRGWDLTICPQFGLHQQSKKPYGLLYAIKNIADIQISPRKKTLLISNKVFPEKDGEWFVLNQLLNDFNEEEMLLLTDEGLSPYAPDYSIKDVVEFSSNRANKQYLTIPHLKVITYDIFQNYLDILVKQNGIEAIIFTDETENLHNNIKRFCLENNITSLCIFGAEEEISENADLYGTLKNTMPLSSIKSLMNNFLKK